MCSVLGAGRTGTNFELRFDFLRHDKPGAVVELFVETLPGVVDQPPVLAGAPVRGLPDTESSVLPGAFFDVTAPIGHTHINTTAGGKVTIFQRQTRCLLKVENQAGAFCARFAAAAMDFDTIKAAVLPQPVELLRVRQRLFSNFLLPQTPFHIPIIALSVGVEPISQCEFFDYCGLNPVNLHYVARFPPYVRGNVLKRLN